MADVAFGSMQRAIALAVGNTELSHLSQPYPLASPSRGQSAPDLGRL